MSSSAYLLGGLPGSGKSTTADILETLTGGTVLSAGQLVRQLAKDDGLEEPTSKELGQWSGRRREQDGDAYLEDEIIEMSEAGDYQYDKPLIYDSVRNADGVEVMQDYFTHTCFIWIDANPVVRLERLQDRDRDDEADFTMEDLRERDRIEIQELGQESLLGNDLADHVIVNESTTEELSSKLHTIAHVFRGNRV